MALVIRCPGCRKKFKWKSGTDLPAECPLCGYETGTDRPDDEIVLPAILNRRTKVADQVYRDMERGSEHRMHLAAQVGGGSPSDYAGLKITDMKDNLRPGDISAIEDRAAALRLTNGRSDQAGSFFQANGAESTVGVADGSFMLNGQRVAGDPKSARAGMQAKAKIDRLMGRG